MTEYKKQRYRLITPKDIADLKAIYEDYLYMARQQELVFEYETIDDFAAKQVQEMHPECKDPRSYVIPWSIEKLNIDEQQQFADYIENNICGDGHTAYVSLQHINAEENNGRAPRFAIEPYHNLTVAMSLPSMIEKYTISYPEGATFANTEFHIDGRYRAVYHGDNGQSKLLAEYLSNPDMMTEITIMLKLGECYRQNNYQNDHVFSRKSINVYAEEILNTNENNLLEILGSFAEKIRQICHRRYHQKDGACDLRQAYRDGFLGVPENFYDYLNVRNLIQHQWDTLDDLDNFSLEQSRENKLVRAQRTRSYLKLCDKTIYQRKVSAIEALHQMQQIISAIEPNRLIRGINESNSKFTERVKAACWQNFDKQIEVEMNLPLNDSRYTSLSRILHKPKLFPNIIVVEDAIHDSSKFDLMEDYKSRSFFLRYFHGVASAAMGFCQRRAEDKDNRKAWFYLKDTGIITPEECEKWQDYTSFRNDLAHDYFDANLRKRLKDYEKQYPQDFRATELKIHNANPTVRKIQDNIFKYEHNDGVVGTVNYTSHERHISQQTPATKAPIQAVPTSPETGAETYPNGIEFKLENGKIVGLKLPNKVFINLHNRSINWGNRTRWYANAQYFNALQTERSTLRTNKKLEVTSFFAGSHNQSCNDGDVLTIDDKHTVLLDSAGRIAEFNFKNFKNKIIKSKFEQSENGQHIVSFVDGTAILFSAKNMTVMHNNKVLSYNTRQEFAATYGAQIPPQNANGHGCGR